MKKDNLHKNNGGFKVPEGYFEEFEHKLFDKISRRTDNDSMLSSKIDSGFTIPEDYFTTLEDNVMNNVSETPTKTKVRSLITKRSILYFSGIAAMIAIIISLSTYEESKLNFDDIELADIHHYFNEGNIELSTTEMIALLDEDINYTEVFEEELANDDEILDYLSEEDIDDEIIFVE
ncbi:hypothetical protein [Aquimarina algiphila]|uniref:hypothetical protein n=1 Tax=Aquimarina algiphila TaxID=2047982 RepID=UPI00232F94A2|nr:hypothetical protein [Aquimarina algiphila]